MKNLTYPDFSGLDNAKFKAKIADLPEHYQALAMLLVENLVDSVRLAPRAGQVALV